MAGFKETVGFIFLVCLAFVHSVNDCFPACQNGGTCRGSSSSAYCDCPSGYTGDYCQTRDCSPACQNGGTCNHSSSNGHCDCPSRYTGSYCQYRDCSSECKNGGVCVRRLSYFRCDCPSGYLGVLCQYKDCSPACQNGGTCQVSDSSPSRCLCPKRYTGSYCQNRECFPKCRNGGNCTSSGYCDCAPGYSGSYCLFTSTSGASNGGSSASRDTYVAIVFGSMTGFTAIICCIVVAVTLFANRRKAYQRRHFPALVATHVPPTSAAIDERVTPVQRLHHVTPTNTDGPPSYVASTHMEPSEPPPYTADHVNSPMATAVENTHTSLEDTSQPLPSEFIPIEDDLPPEYLPPPGSELEMVPLHSAPPTNSDTPSDPPTSTAGLSICSPHTSMQDTPTPQSLPPESSASPNNENLLSEHHPPASSDYEAPPVQGVPHMDVNAPPPCVPSIHLQSSNSAPCTSNTNSCSIPTSVEDTPTPQSLPPESSVSSNNENPLSEHHPPAGSDYEAPPVQGVPPMDINAPPPCVPSIHLQSSNSAPCTSNTNSCSIPTSVEDTPTPQPLLPESPHSMPNDEDVELEYLPTHGSSL